MPVQTPAPSPPQTPIPAQITAHPPNPPKSQFRQCQSRHPTIPAQITAHPPNPPKSQFRQCQSRHPSPPHPKLPSPRKSQPIRQIPPNPDNPSKCQFRQCQSRHPPPPHPKLPSPRKSQPIHQIPPNHSSDNASPDTRPLPTPNSHPRANHSPSTKSPQITVQTMTVQTMPVQTPAPSHPKLPSPRKSQPIPQIPPNHSSDHPDTHPPPSAKSPKSQFRPDFQLTKISNEVYNCSSELTHPCLCDPEKLRLRVWRRRSSDWRRRFHDWNSPPSEIHLHAAPLPVHPPAGHCLARPRRSTASGPAARRTRHNTWWWN